MHDRVRTASIAVAALAVMLVMAPTAQSRPGARLDRVEKRIVELVNRERARHGLSRVSVSRDLNRSAHVHSVDMLRHDFFAHASSNGRSMSRRIMAFRPSRRVGENLAWVSHRDAHRARAVVRMWMASPGHRAMILMGGFRRIGVARRSGVLGTMRAMVYTADFATRR